MRNLNSIKARITNRYKDGPCVGMRVRNDGEHLWIELPEKNQPFSYNDLKAWRFLVKDLDALLRADGDIKSHQIDTPFELVEQLGPNVAYVLLAVEFYSKF